jgi:hypothetical protein
MGVSSVLSAKSNRPAVDSDFFSFLELCEPTRNRDLSDSDNNAFIVAFESALSHLSFSLVGFIGVEKRPKYKTLKNTRKAL